MVLSTAEAEYIALSGAALESLWLQQLLAYLMKEEGKFMVIYEYNQSAINMTKIHSFMVEQSILSLSIILSGSRLQIESWN